MKKAFVVLGSSMFVFLVMACGGLSNEEACKKVESLCSGGGSSSDAGVTITTTLRCQPDGFDKMSNDSDVKECIEKASDCQAALTCMGSAKPE